MQRGLQYLVCVSVCVCVSVTQHLTFHVIIRAINNTILLSGGWRSKLLSDFLWKCFIAKLERSCWYSYMVSLPFFIPQKMCMHMNLAHVASGHFVLGRDTLCEFNYWPLAVSLPPTKVCLQCKAAVPVRRKTCECCDLVFQSKWKAECNLREKTVQLWNVWEQ